MILAPTNRRIVRPYDKPSFEHTQRYGLIKGHPLGPAGGLIFFGIMNEGSGNKVFDLSGNGNVGTFNGSPLWLPGKFSSCVDFDSSTPDYISCPASPTLNNMFAGGGAWSMCFYADTIGTDPRIIDKSIGSSELGGRIVLEEPTKLGFRHGFVTNPGYWQVDAPLIGTSRWIHVAVSYDSDSVDNNPVILIDGIVGTLNEWKTPVGAARDDSVSPLYFAIRGDLNAGRALDGKIDNVALWNRALTASEMAFLYSEPFCMVQREAAPVYFFVPTVGGEDYFRTINNGVGITDAMSRSQAQVRTIDDGVGSVDSVGRTQVQSRTLAESLGLVDSLWKNETRVFTDVVGITDAITKSQTFARTIADDIGLIDNVTKLITYVRTLAESLGITDAAIPSVGHPRTVADTIGITDSIVRTQIQARIVADAMGITDEMSRLQAQLRTIADSLGLTDVMTPGQLVVFEETIGMTDAMTKTQAQIRVVADTLGITDDLTRIAAYVFTQGDSIGIADAMIRVAIALRTVNDNVGMTDVMSIEDLIKAAWAFMIMRQTHN